MSVICGLDEAGRGPLAGPVTAAAVILPPDFPVELLNDSKKLSAKKRGMLEILIKEKAVAWAVSSVDEKEIDRINILRASLLAMKQAFESLYKRLYENLPDPCPAIECIADGTFCPGFRFGENGTRPHYVRLRKTVSCIRLRTAQGLSDA